MYKILAMKKAIELIKNELRNMPNLPGVYRMLDKNNKVLYVGKAKDLSKRIVNYTQTNRLCERMKLAISQTEKLEIITVETEAQALILEANLIKSLKPKYNILLKDDKSMPYILIRDDHDYGQILKFRGNKNASGKYFGPFASSKKVDETIEFLEKNFLLRNCSDHFFSSRKTACMQYQINRCSAPCVGKISLAEYKKNVRQAINFLEGKSVLLQHELSKAMNEASENMEYEKAAKYRDQIKALNFIQNKNDKLFCLDEADVIAIDRIDDLASVQIFLFRNGQNYGNRSILLEQTSDEELEKILSIFLSQHYQTNIPPKEVILSIEPQDKKELKEALNLNITIPKSGKKFNILKSVQDNASIALTRKYSEMKNKANMLEKIQHLFEIDHEIQRIEVYDNSHISGSHAVGAMIVANKEGFVKNQYRKYNIETSSNGDDYQMLREVLIRRFKKPENLPDLILVDGGEGHLNVAHEVLKQMGYNIPLVCVSKGIERNAGREIFHQKNKESFTLDKHDSQMKFLQILRDEAHRYAITSHRKRRNIAMNFSILSQIPGVGPTRRKILINHFTSIEEIKNASIEQIKKLEGINKKTAEEIYNFFKQNR